MAENETRLASSDGLPAALQAVLDSARRDNVAHLELAVSPAALAGALGSLEAAFEAMTVALRGLASDGFPSVGWLVSLAANAPWTELAQTLALAHQRREDGILGVVVLMGAGDPPETDDLLADAIPPGLPIMVQLSPEMAPETAFQRLTRLAPARVTFGNITLQSLDALGWIRQNRPAIVVCLTAERLTGAWVGETAHPLVQMIQAGMQVSLASWAPGLLEISLTREYALAAEPLALTLEALRGVTLAGVQASFLPEPQKRRLEREFEDTIFGFPTGA